MNRKIQAFTLTELLVVMILMGIITGIIYMAYYAVNTYQITLTRKYENMEILNTYYHTLDMDFERSQQVNVVSDRSIECMLDDQTRISYQFLADAIVRQQVGRIDTFACKSGQVMFAFQEKPISKGLIDELRFQTMTIHGNVEVALFKYYDAATLIFNDNLEKYGRN